MTKGSVGFRNDEVDVDTRPGAVNSMAKAKKGWRAGWCLCEGKAIPPFYEGHSDGFWRERLEQNGWLSGEGCPGLWEQNAMLFCKWCHNNLWLVVVSCWRGWVWLHEWKRLCCEKGMQVWIRFLFAVCWCEWRKMGMSPARYPGICRNPQTLRPNHQFCRCLHSNSMC